MDPYQILGACSWRVPAECNLSWRRWQDEFVVYDSASGNTHVLDLLSGSVLSALEIGPSTISSLVSGLQALFPEADQNTLESQIARSLQALRRLELAEPDPQCA